MILQARVNKSYNTKLTKNQSLASGQLQAIACIFLSVSCDVDDESISQDKRSKPGSRNRDRMSYTSEEPYDRDQTTGRKFNVIV